MTTSRTLHPACCLKCQGTGYYVGRNGWQMVCLHESRVDVTGLDDDTERILCLERQLEAAKAALATGPDGYIVFSLRQAIEAGDVEKCRERAARSDEFIADLQAKALRVPDLERRLTEITAERDAAFNEGVEEAAKAIESEIGAWGRTTSAEAAEIARSLKRGVKPGV